MSEEEDVFVGVLKEGEIGAFCLFSFQQNTFLQEGATETLGCAAFSLLSLPSTKQFMLLTRFIPVSKLSNQVFEQFMVLERVISLENQIDW